MTIDLNLIFFAIVMHYIADFPMQGDFLANCKGKYDYLLFAHSVIWTGCICLPLAYFAGPLPWWKIGFLLAGHFCIDRWKARKTDKTHAMTFDLWADQMGHWLQIIVVAVF